jgi:lipopolysaccharide export system permease protein
MILGLYMTRVYAVRFFGALAGFAALVQLLDLFEVAGEILERGEGMLGLLRYTALRMPVILVDVAPFAALIGALFTFMALAGKSEVIAMRALGLAPRKIVMLLAPIVLLLGGLHLIANDRVAPPAEAALRDWMLRTADEQPPAEDAESWLRSGPILIGFGGAAPDGARLERVWIYERSATDNLQRRITAARAIYEGRLWRLEDAAVDQGLGERQAESEMTIDLRLTPADVLELSQPLEHLSLAQLHQGATGGPTGARSEAFFRTRLMMVWSFMAVPAIMLVIAAPVAFASIRRRGAVGLQAALGLGWGLGFILLAGILRTLGESGVLPALVAVWTAPLLFALMAAARLSDTK